MNNKLFIIALSAASLLTGTLTAEAEVTLPKILSDGMVVQRNHPVQLWGTAEPGETVTAKVDKVKKATATTVADAQGNWSLSLPELKVGGPYTIEINDIKIGDVLCGDVLLCSGQSNMELPVARVTDMFANEIASYENPNIRQLYVPRETEFHQERKDMTYGQWKPLNQDNRMSFSALAYFTAKDLYENEGVPVGIINTCWGGTPIEAWVRESTLEEKYPYGVNQKAIYNDDEYRRRLKQTEAENYARWNQTLYAADMGASGDKKWYADDLDDSSWEEVDMFSGDWATDGMNPINGSHWFRKNFNLTAEQASEPATLRLGCIVDADSVYVNGVFVGNITYQYPPRIYKVSEDILRQGENNVTIHLISNGGTPHFVAEKPYKLITAEGDVSLDGTWRHKLGARMPSAPSSVSFHYLPAVLYNAMISPVINFPVRAAVWYQGESNVGRSNEYPALMEMLVGDWREASGDPQMPFFVVELADFLHQSDKGGRAAWAKMRQQQAVGCDAIEGCYLVPNSDLGEWNDIHPLDKKTLGARVSKGIREHAK